MQKKLGNSIVEYNPETGDFIWLLCYRKPSYNGMVATHATSNGYLYIKAGGKNHSASRLAIELYTGKSVPSNLVVDHINRVTFDNRIENLRVVTQRENLAHLKMPLGKSGVRGIRIYNRPSGNGFMWRADINGKSMYWPTLEEAIAGYANLGAEACDE